MLRDPTSESAHESDVSIPSIVSRLSSGSNLMHGDALDSTRATDVLVNTGSAYGGDLRSPAQISFEIFAGYGCVVEMYYVIALFLSRLYRVYISWF
eukprot:SAG31_NODE_13473_length_866_cov_4.308996_2_plen_95_part_01